MRVNTAWILTRTTTIAVCLVWSGALLSAGRGAQTSTDASAAPVPVLTWRPCADPDQRGFDCATAEVPLDYGEPNGETISLALIKHPATDSANRIGSLFFNPGGPGGAGTDDLPAWINDFAPELRARFDIISWDPRGIGASTAVQCFDTEEDEKRFFAGVPYNFFPTGAAQQREWIMRFAEFGRVCGQRNGKLLEHVSTADSAKDLDQLRQAVGDAQLNYLGVSYGTFLGATYANLFPDKVRALVLDGNIDPVAYMNGGRQSASLSTSQRLGSDLASAKTLGAFLDLCGEASLDQCAFSAGSATATRAQWQTLLERVRQHPIKFGKTTITYAVLVSYVGGVLFTVEARPGFSGWTDAARNLQTFWELSDPATADERSTFKNVESDASLAAVNDTEQEKYAGPEQLYSVQCSDSPNPRNPWIYPWLDSYSYKRAGALGSFTVWGDQPCASWPAIAADRYTGPWDRHTANPIMVIGNTFDPATPYEDAVAMAHYLARARLLTVDGYGHTVLLNPSACAQEYESRYFIDGTLPPAGTVCRQDVQPFPAGQASP